MSQSIHAIQQVLAAAQFAAQQHASQRRKGEAAEPYINHLIEVAELVATALAEDDTNLVVAALLHDTIEDTATSKIELEEKFGPDVAELVTEMTDDKSLPKAERKRLQIDHAPRMSQRAQMVKIADKISNLRALISSPPAGWDVDRKKAYVEWAQQVVAGLSAPNPALKAEFERTIQNFVF